MAKDTGTKLIAENRRSRHDYELLERVEAGIVLSGTEVKALREGHAQIGQAFADVRNGEMWLIGASISEYAQGNISNHITDRDRKLLLKRSEIDSLYAKVREKGLTLVPTKLYFKDGKVKVEVALGFAYGVALHNWALIIPNTIAFIVGATTIAVARHYRRDVP